MSARVHFHHGLRGQHPGARFLVVLAAAGCGLTVTREPPTYEDLDAEERAAADRILESLEIFHEAVGRRGGPGIDALRDIEAVQVHFEGLIVATNLGDGFARVSVWENLGDGQRARVASWWDVDEDAAAERYVLFFYDYLATHLAALEWIYVVQGVERVLNDRPRFNVERDAERLVVAHFREQDPPLVGEVGALCGPMRAQYDGRWGEHYEEDADCDEHRPCGRWFRDHLAELADPADPTGYVYYFCRWFDAARERSYSFRDEMDLVKQRFGYRAPR